MESMFTMFLLFFAAMTALLTYAMIPRLPVVALTSGAAIVLAATVWWHWTQFSEEYRISSWQDALRNYASYALLLLVIVLSYGFYVFAWNGEAVQEYISSASNSIRNVGRKTSARASRAISSTSNTLFGEVSVEPEVVAPARNTFLE